MADVTSRTIPVESLGVELSRYTFALVEVRLERLLNELALLIRQAYEERFLVTNAAGASASIEFEVNRTTAFITGIIGGSQANSYLKYIEYGVRGTESGQGFYTRTKMPPVKNIYEWVRKSALRPRAEGEKSKQHGDAMMSLAWAIAKSIQKHGTPAAHIIERVLTQQKSRIEQVLSAA